jgi:hypothetical protein
VSQLIGALIQLSIGHRPLFKEHSNGMRLLLCLFLEQLMKAFLLGEVGLCLIPRYKHLLLLGCGQEWQWRNPRISVGDDALELWLLLGLLICRGVVSSRWLFSVGAHPHLPREDGSVLG